MKNKKIGISGETIFLLILLALGIYFFVASNVQFSDNTYKVRTFPLVISGTLIVLCAAEFITGALRRRKESRAVRESPEAQAAAGAGELEAGAEEQRNPPPEEGNLWFGFLWLLGVVLGVTVLGFYIALPAFSVSYLRRHKVKWVICLAFALVILAVIYFGFNRLLRVRLFNGILFGDYFR